MEEKNWRGAQWIGNDQDQDAGPYVPGKHMGPWIQPLPGSKVRGLFRDSDLPDKPVVSAIVWRGNTKSLGAVYLHANYETADSSLRKHMQMMRRGNVHGFYEFVFLLKPGTTSVAWSLAYDFSQSSSTDTI